MFKGKEHKQEKNRGITLIALVITIIVMLILVAVTITMAINGGLFENAGRVVGETQNELNKEQQIADGKIQIDGVWYNSIDDYLANRPSAVHNWTREGDTFTCSHCNAEYTMGDVVEYTPAGNASATITAEMSGLNRYYEEKLEYPTYAIVDENGNQPIEVQETNWVVLGIEDTDGDGANETLLITTLYSVWQGIYFYGAEAYNNGPSEINRICKELYSNSEYGKARGITIEDINNAFNNPLEGMHLGGKYYDVDTDTYNKTGNLTTKLRDLPIWNSIKTNGTYTPDGVNTEEALGEYELNGYSLLVNDTGTALVDTVSGETHNITDVERSVIYGSSGYSIYWLASRGVDAIDHRSVASFGLYRVDYSYTYVDSLFFSDGSEVCWGAGVRPVVSLTSKLPELGK